MTASTLVVHVLLYFLRSTPHIPVFYRDAAIRGKYLSWGE